LVDEPDVGEDGARAGDDVRVRPVMAQHRPVVVAGLAGDPDVLEDGRAGQDVGDLVGAGDRLARDGVGRQPRDVLAVEHDPAARRAEHAGQAVEEGGLPGAVWADDPADLAPRHGNADVVDSRRNAWWSSFRMVLSPCGKSSLSLTSMPSRASIRFIVSSRPRNRDFCMPSFRKFIASKFDWT